MSDCFKPKPEDYWQKYCGPEGAISEPRAAATPKTKKCEKPKREQKPEQKPAQKKRRSFLPGLNFGDERSHDDHRKRAQQQEQERQRQQEQEREQQRQRDAEAQRQREAEAERQRQAEAQRQRDEARAKQAEADREKARQAEAQRQQDRQRNRSFLPNVNFGEEKSYAPRQQEQRQPQQREQPVEPGQKRRSLPGVNFGDELPHTAKPVRLPEFVPTPEVEAPAPTPRSNTQPPIALPNPEPAPKPRTESRQPISIPVELPEPISIPVELPEPIRPVAEKPQQERQEPKPRRVSEPIDWSGAINGLGSFFGNRPTAPTIDVSRDLEDIAALEDHYRKQPIMTEIPLPNNFRAARPRGEVVNLPSAPTMALPQIKMPLPSIELPELVPVENKEAQPLKLKMEDRR